jgi:hypothetical protein
MKTTLKIPESEITNILITKCERTFEIRNFLALS